MLGPSSLLFVSRGLIFLNEGLLAVQKSHRYDCRIEVNTDTYSGPNLHGFLPRLAEVILLALQVGRKRGIKPLLAVLILRVLAFKDLSISVTPTQHNFLPIHLCIPQRVKTLAVEKDEAEHQCCFQICERYAGTSQQPCVSSHMRLSGAYINGETRTFHTCLSLQAVAIVCSMVLSCCDSHTL